MALAIALLHPLPPGEHDLTRSMHWPEPALSPDMAASLALDRGPVAIPVKYRIARKRAQGFLPAMADFSHLRVRDGAYQWGVYEDAVESGRYIEGLLVPSWLEHQRQHLFPQYWRATPTE